MTVGVTKVAVVSPQPVVMEGFTTMLSHHPERVMLMQDPSLPRDVEPDVVLYDVLGLAQGDDSELRHLVNETGAVVFAVGRDLRPDLLSRALSLGADGFFSLGVSEVDLLLAIESATTGWEAGDAAPDPVVGSSGSAQRAMRLGVDVGLSPRETGILALIAQGMSNSEIAQTEFVSINSVKTYIRSAYRKIGVTSRTQAVVWAVQHGFDTRQSNRPAGMRNHEGSV
jgi:DNA-binding NarL/FixJ family response regulator